MRGLTRLPEPQILQERATRWRNDLIESGRNRPDFTKYAHPEIRVQLGTMSSYKCFYCETLLKNSPREVDHQIEVSVNIGLSYTWTNLYLSCDNCNNKIDHNTIPITEALDPCRNTDAEIQEHIYFIQETITPLRGSPLGLNTIRKYRLDTELLDRRRLLELKNFYKLLCEIRKNQVDEGGRPLYQQELDAINYFKQIDRPYSLMFKIIIDTI